MAGDSNDSGSPAQVSDEGSSAITSDCKFPERSVANFDDPEEQDDPEVRELALRLVVHPSAKWKAMWDLFVGALIVYSVVSVPFRIGFDYEAQPGSGFWIFDWFVDCSFMLDMVVALRTAYVQTDGRLISDDQSIALAYLRGSFGVDFASTMPWDKILTGDPSMLRATKLLRVLRMARLLKLVKLLKIGRILGRPEDDVRVNPALISLVKMLVQLLFIGHLLACVWHWLFTFSEQDLNWVTYAGLFIFRGPAANISQGEDDGDVDGPGDFELGQDYKFVDWQLQYANSIYWAFTTMTTVGYGDINPANNGERIMAILTMLLGASVFGYVIGNVTVMMENMDMQATLYREKMDRVKEYLRDRQFPAVSMRRIKQHFNYFYRRSSVFDNAQEFISGLPQTVAVEVLEKQYQKLISGSTFLREAPQGFKVQTLDKFRPFYLEPGEFLFFEGEVATHLFLLVSGELQGHIKTVAGPHLGFASFTNDSLIGEPGILMDGRHVCTMLCTKPAHMFSVAKEDLVFVLELFPDVTERLEASSHAIVATIDRVRHTPLAQIKLMMSTAGPAEASTAWSSSGGGSYAHSSATPASPSPPTSSFATSKSSSSGGELRVQDVRSNAGAYDEPSSPGIPGVSTPVQEPASLVGSKDKPAANGGVPEISPSNRKVELQLLPHDLVRGPIEPRPVGEEESIRGDQIYAASSMQPTSSTAVGTTTDPPPAAKTAATLGSGPVEGRHDPSAAAATVTATNTPESDKGRGDDPWTFTLQHRLIHPELSMKNYWDVWVCLLIVYSVLTVTFMIGFQVEEQGYKIPAWFTGLGWAVDVCFGVDIVLGFFSTFFDDGDLVLDHRRVARSYLMGWFPLDFLSTFPFDLMGAGGVAGQFKLIRALRLARLVKISRLLKMSDVLERHEDTVSINPALVRLLKLFVLMAFVAHMNACLWFYVGYDSMQTGSGESWITADCVGGDDDGLYEARCLDERSLYSKYIAAVYWAFTTMTTVGYGDISASLSSSSEIALSILSEVIGTTIFAYVIGTLVSLVLNLDPGERNRKQQMEYLNNYLQDLSLHKDQRRHLRRHYIYRITCKSVFQEDQILDLIPPHIKQPALLFLYRHSLPRMPWICDLEHRFHGIISVLLPKLKPAAFSRGDLVNGPTVNARELCFVMSGAVKARMPTAEDPAVGKDHHAQVHPVAADEFFEVGDYFGEATLIIPDDIPFRLRVEYSAASRICNVLVLTRLDYAQIKMVYKQICSEIEQDLVDGDAELYQIVEVDQERMQSEYFADMATESAHRLPNAGAAKQGSGAKPKRKKRGRGRGR